MQYLFKFLFFFKVTEKEINEGLNDNNNSQILCFLREFKAINHEDSKAIKFSGKLKFFFVFLFFIFEKTLYYNF
jgi:hypothetical protein